MSPVIEPLIRRAILDLLEDIGGEQNDEVLSIYLNALGHRLARRDVKEMLRWLSARGLVKIEELAPYLVVSIDPDGRDVASGRLQIDGISRHKTGD